MGNICHFFFKSKIVSSYRCSAPKDRLAANDTTRRRCVTLAALFSWYMDGSSAAFPAAHLVAPISSARALATSLTAFIKTTYRETGNT